jgi:uncharacterized protein YciI
MGKKPEGEKSMFVAISTYQKPLEEVLQVYPDHLEWLMKHYTAGRFLGSGRRVPPVGGLILAREDSREAFLALLEEDPFQRNGLATYEVFEFNVLPLPARASELEAFLSRPISAEGTATA